MKKSIFIFVLFSTIFMKGVESPDVFMDLCLKSDNAKELTKTWSVNFKLNGQNAEDFRVIVYNSMSRQISIYPCADGTFFFMQIFPCSISDMKMLYTIASDMTGSVILMEPLKIYAPGMFVYENVRIRESSAGNLKLTTLLMCNLLTGDNTGFNKVNGMLPINVKMPETVSCDYLAIALVKKESMEHFAAMQSRAILQPEDDFAIQKLVPKVRTKNIEDFLKNNSLVANTLFIPPEGNWGITTPSKDMEKQLQDLDGLILKSCCILQKQKAYYLNGNKTINDVRRAECELFKLLIAKTKILSASSSKSDNINLVLIKEKLLTGLNKNFKEHLNMIDAEYRSGHISQEEADKLRKEANDMAE